MKEVRIGIIGCGGIATAKHIPNILKDKRASIVAICENFAPQKAEKAIEEFALIDCKLYEDVEDFLKDDRIEVVHVCTPNSGHASLTIKALKAGKHVMCEKPMATSVSLAQDMIEAAKKYGKKLTICANNRFKKDSWYLKNLCAQGEFGEIYYAKAFALRRRGVPTWGQFLSKEAQGGGPVIDIGTHALDLALWMMDNYQPAMVVGKTNNKMGKLTSEANPYGNWKSEEFEVEDFGVGMIVMQNGAIITLESSWILNLRDEKAPKITLCGTMAGADMDDGLVVNGEKNGRMYETKINLDPPKIPFYGTNDGYGPELEIRQWLDCIVNDTDPVVLPEQMLMVMKIIEAIYKSDETGKPIYF